MRVTLLTSVLMAMLALSGCAAMSEKECKRADWREIGQRDGANGHEPKQRLASYRESCAKVKIKPDEASYMTAWREAVAQYCTAENGFDVGRRGVAYEGVCTGPSARLFRVNYDAGYRIYDLERQKADVQDQIETLEAKLIDCSKRKDDKECELSLAERHSINRKIDDLYAELKVLRNLLAVADVFSIVRD